MNTNTPHVDLPTRTEDYKRKDQSPWFVMLVDGPNYTGISYAHLNRMIDAGEICQPVKVTSRRRAFIKSELDAWIAERIKRQRAGEEQSFSQQSAA